MITRNAFENILKEYDEKQLRAARDLQERRALIERHVPRLREIENEIAAISIKGAIERIGGSQLRSSKASNDMKADTKSRIATLREEKKAVLQQAGYSLSDLKAHYECSKCNDTGYIGSDMCSCLNNRITEVLYENSNIKEILKEENFDNYSFRYYPEGQALTVAEQAVKTAHRFVDNFATSSDNLFITGETGVGKTFLTNCIAKELIEQGYFVVYLSAVRLFDILSDATFGYKRNDTDGVSGDYIKNYLYKCDLLVIDDLGTEMVNSFTSTQLFDCVNERLLSRKHTIISTNLSLDQLRFNYSERLVSRIVNKYTLIKLFGDDIRMKKKLEA